MRMQSTPRPAPSEWQTYLGVTTAPPCGQFRFPSTAGVDSAATVDNGVDLRRRRRQLLVRPQRHDRGGAVAGSGGLADRCL